MSLPPLSFSCSKCDFHAFYGVGARFYSYLLTNGDKIHAPTKLGWCMKCNTIIEIVLGFSVEILHKEIDDFNLELYQLNVEKEFHKEPRSLDQKIQSINTEIDNKKKYLSLIENHDTKHTCTECGENEVIPMKIGNNLYYADGIQAIHFGCGGNLIVDEPSGLRFSFSPQEIIVKPSFV